MAKPRLVIEIRGGMVWDAIRESELEEVEVIIMDHDAGSLELLDTRRDDSYVATVFGDYEGGQS